MAQEYSSARLHGAVQPRYGEVHIRNRGRLPHWEKEEGLYFITFHLADSLPHSVLARIAERHHILTTAKENNANLLPEQKALLASYGHTCIEEYFDRGVGSCAFNDRRIAGAMAAALRFREGMHYRLLAWCIMPNHVHVVVRLFPGQELARVVKAWKNFSAGCPILRVFCEGWETTNLDRPYIPLENFAVRTDAHQPQCLVVRFFVDKKQIRLQMALAMIRIFARQRMIVKSLRQGLVRRQR
jgi:REP element-mobilizing transposase RayT